VTKKAEENRAERHESERSVSVVINKLVNGMDGDLENFKFNTAIAKMMIALNELEKGGKISVDDLRKMVQVLAPIAPFVAEELWNILGGEFSVHGTSWPEVDEKYLVERVVTISVQVNGKLRGTVEIKPDADEVEVKEAALEQEKIKKYLSGEIKKVIFIKGKTINFVA
jgi:leucyl-tRNA synthetase